MMKTPLIALAGAVACGVLIWQTYMAGYRSGGADQALKCQTLIEERDRATAKAVQQAQEEQEIKNAKALAIERTHLEEQTRNAKEFEILAIKAEARARSAGLNRCSVGADIMQLWNQANRGAGRVQAGDTSKPAD